MKPNRDGEFEKHINQLVQLLRKIMMSHPPHGSNAKWPPFLKDLKEQGINLNICFLNFFPLPEDMEMLDELYEHFETDADPESEEFDAELSASDIEFLKRYGIRY
ncbi:MAG: hypothetical protein PHN49_07145 [Candidatus Omnitrophica bacterium]|nr:hypothetical protein [Candidatus Omnitrophota bacterium]